MLTDLTLHFFTVA